MTTFTMIAFTHPDKLKIEIASKEDDIALLNMEIDSILPRIAGAGTFEKKQLQAQLSRRRLDREEVERELASLRKRLKAWEAAE